MSTRFLRVSFVVSLLCTVGVPLASQAPPPAPAAVPPTGFPGLDRYRASRVAVYSDDYGERARYRAANAALPAPAPTENRVVFFGDSITDFWRLDQSFPGKPYVNRGIGGQTTSQMLVRFRQDVIELRPKGVVILAGTNDIAGNTGPMSDEEIEGNLASLADLARAHDIRVVLSSVTPVHNYKPRAQEFFASRPAARIVALNRWMREYSAANGVVYLDYYTAMVDDRGMLQRDLAEDGLHPNAAGYALMARLADAAIQRALAPDRRATFTPEHWVSTWGTAQPFAPASGPPGGRDDAAIPRTLGDRTVRMIARASIGGSRVRIQLANALDKPAVRIGTAHVALRATGGAIRQESDRALTFGGAASTVLPPGAVVISEPVDLAIPGLADVAVSLYVPDDVGIPTAHAIGLHTAYVTRGNAVAAATFGTAETTTTYPWLYSVDVLAPSNAGAIVAFGDSITDGYATTVDRDQGWPALLAVRLASVKATETLGVVNAGIAGNRVLRTGVGASALARFDRDVVSRAGVRWMTLLEGINDITFSAIPAMRNDAVSAGDLIWGYRQIIDRAHLHGIKIMGATIMPVQGVATYTDDGEAVRQAVNRWIRTSGAFDAVVDFDAVVRDPRNLQHIRPEFDSGDHVHPNDAGNAAMAAAIDVSLFARQGEQP